MNANSECWISATKELARWIQGCFAIVYMYFTNKVWEMSKTLWMEHALHWKSFYSKNVILDQRMHTMKAFCNQEFQVSCATESYEVGIHNPHVEFVARVGCMRSISVFMQELGRAGRTDDHSLEGLLLFNERVAKCAAADQKKRQGSRWRIGNKIGPLALRSKAGSGGDRKYTSSDRAVEDFSERKRNCRKRLEQGSMGVFAETSSTKAISENRFPHILFAGNMFPKKHISCIL
eukprot:gene13270-14637_t